MSCMMGAVPPLAAMLIILKQDASTAQIQAVADAVRTAGRTPHLVEGADWTVILAAGSASEQAPLEASSFARMPGVRRVLPLGPPWRRVAGTAPASFEVAGREITANPPVLAAGPCAVESPEQILETAREVARAGADLLRGGCFKFRTSPYTFQGLEEEGLRALAAARAETGLGIVTECLDPRHVELVAEVADMIQVGARNMQNVPLLREIGRVGKPVLLKRGPGAELEEWLLAAEHVANAGEERIVFCERGIRTFSRHSRYTLDLSVLPRLREETNLPVWVDPSHATGRSASVPAMARAAVAAGADGLLLEVHPRPREARSDGPQAITPAVFAELAEEVRALASTLERVRV